MFQCDNRLEWSISTLHHQDTSWLSQSQDDVTQMRTRANQALVRTESDIPSIKIEINTLINTLISAAGEIGELDYSYPSSLQLGIASHLVYKSRDEDKWIKENEELEQQKKKEEKEKIPPQLQETITITTVATLPNAETELKKDMADFYRSWIPIASVSNSTNHYFGQAFFDRKNLHLIIAHRGTVPYLLGTVEADIEGIIYNKFTHQMNSATTFVLVMCEVLKELKEVQLSITGHSLGGWLAQVTTYAAKHLKMDKKEFKTKKEPDVFPHCETFDSPGARQILQKINKNFVGENNWIDKLDISVYFGEPNAINTLNEHVGNLFMLNDLDESECWSKFETKNIFRKFQTWIRKGFPLKRFLYYTSGSHKLISIIGQLRRAQVMMSKVRQLQAWPGYIVQNWTTEDEITNPSNSTITKFKRFWSTGTTLGSLLSEFLKCSKLTELVDVFEKRCQGQDSHYLKWNEFDPNSISLNLFTDKEVILLTQLSENKKSNAAQNWEGDLQNIGSVLAQVDFVSRLVKVESSELGDKSFFQMVRRYAQMHLSKLPIGLESEKEIMILIQSKEYEAEVCNKFIQVQFEDSFEKGDNSIWKKITQSVDSVVTFDHHIHEVDFVRYKVVQVMKGTETKCLFIKAKDFKKFGTGVILKEKFQGYTILIDALSDDENEFGDTDMQWVRQNEAHLLRLKGDSHPSLKLEVNFDRKSLTEVIGPVDVIFQGREARFDEVFPQIRLKHCNSFFNSHISAFQKLCSTDKETRLEICSRPSGFFEDGKNYIDVGEWINETNWSDRFNDGQTLFLYGEKDISSHIENIKNLQERYQIEFTAADTGKSALEAFHNFVKLNPKSFANLFKVEILENGGFKFYWQLQFNPNFYKKRELKLNREILLSCDGVPIIPNKAQIWIDVAGMGKSTTMTLLCEEYVKNNPKDLVLKLELRKLILNMKTPKVPSVSDLVSFLLPEEKQSGTFFACSSFAVKYRLENSRGEENCKLVLFLDGFDEMDEESAKVFANNYFPTFQSLGARLSISSRPTAPYLYEMTGCEHFEFVPLTDYKDFLVNYWAGILNVKLKKANGTKNSTANQVLTALEKINDKKVNLLNDLGDVIVKRAISHLSQSGQELDFLGVPLQLRLLSEVYLKEASSINTEEEINKFKLELEKSYTIKSLYEKFITRKYEILFQEKMGLPVGFSKLVELQMLADEPMLMVLGIKEAGYNGSFLNGPMFNPRVNAKDEKEFNEKIINLGLFNLQINHSPTFIHRTFAEFYTAKWMVKTIREMVFSYKPTAIDSEATYFNLTQLTEYWGTLTYVSSEVNSGLLRLFMNGFLEEDTELLSRLEGNGKRILQFGTGLPWNADVSTWWKALMAGKTEKLRYFCLALIKAFHFFSDEDFKHGQVCNKVQYFAENKEDGIYSYWVLKFQEPEDPGDKYVWEHVHTFLTYYLDLVCFNSDEVKRMYKIVAKKLNPIDPDGTLTPETRRMLKVFLRILKFGKLGVRKAFPSEEERILRGSFWSSPASASKDSKKNSKMDS